MRRLTFVLLAFTIALGYFAFSRTAPASDPIKLLYAFLALVTSLTGMMALTERRSHGLSEPAQTAQTAVIPLKN